MKVTLDNGGTVDLGITEVSPTVGITDYSRRVTDDFGVTTVVRRGFARRMSLRFAMDYTAVDAVQAQLADLRATPALWVADDRYRALAIRGIFKDFDIDLAVPPQSYCSLTVDGLAESDVAPDPGGDPAVAGMASTLRLIQPVTIDDSVLTASNVPENDAPAWTAGTTYGDAARVIAGHRVFESLTAGNVGGDPLTTTGKWVDVGPTNRWAAFDQALGTVMAAAAPIVVTLASGTADALALLDVTGVAVRVQANGYDRTQAVTPGALTFTDLPGGAVTVTIAGPGTVSVGTLLIGRMVALGVTEASPTAGITDYSRKEVDDFGEVTIVQRAWSKRMQARALIRADAVDTVFDRIAALRSVPALWIGDADSDALTIYGFFKDFSIEIGDTIAKLSLTVEGLSRAAKVEPLKVPVTWEEVTDPHGTKPKNNADETAKNTAKDTAAVGGRPAAEVVSAITKIEPMVGDLAVTKGVVEAQKRALDTLRTDNNAAFDLLGRDGLAKAEALRSIDDELQRLGHIALSSLLDHEETRRIMRDAGISVDPAEGTATIWAIEQLKDQTRKVELTIDAQAAEIRQKVTVDRVEEMILLAQLDPSQLAELEPLIRRVTSVEQVASGLLASLSAKAEAAELTRTTARLTTVSQELDALAGTVDTKASRLEVDAQGVRLTQIGQQLAAMPDGARLSVELTQVRTDAAAGQLATLDALLAGEAAADRRIAEMTQYRQEVITRIDAGLAVEVAERRSLAATMGGIDVRLSAEVRGLVTATGGTARQVAALEVVAQQQTAQIGDLREASIDAKGGIAGLQTTVRQMGPRADAAELAALDGMLDAEERGVDAQRQLSQVQQEMTTRFVAGEQSAAATKLLLEARIGANDSRIGQTAEAVATLSRSTASRIDAIDVRFGRLTDDIAASQAIVTRDLALLVEKDRAIAADIATLKAEVRDPDTGLSKTRAELLAEVKLSADDRASLARAYNALAAVVGDPITGLERTRSQMLAEVELSASDRAALARKYDALQAIVVDPSTGEPYWVGSIADLRKIVIDGDKLTVERIETVEGTVGQNSASISFLRRVVDGQEAIAQLAVTAAGKVTGFRIDGQERVFAIAADRFIVGDRQIFEVDTTSETVRMRNVEVDRVRAGSIGALGLADSAVQQTAFSMTQADIVVPIYQTGGGGGGGGGDVQPIIGDVEEPPPADDGTRRVFDMTFQKQEAGSVLRLLAYMNFASNDDLKLTAAILVDGITRQVCEINLGLDNANSKARAPMTIPAFLTGVPAGAHRVELIVRNFETDTALTVRAGATIEITEIKRGAL